MTVTCSECGRTIPVAPGYFNVTAPHVSVPAHTGVARVCGGNDKREWRDALVHEATRIAQQYAILDDDAYWESL